MTVVYASVTLVLILSTSKETRGLSVGSHWPCHRQGRLVGPWWVPSCHLPHLVGFWLAASITPQCPAPCAPFPWDFPCDSAGKESACNAGDLGSIPGSGRSPGEGKVYPLQYSGLENSIDCIDHGVAKSQTWLSDFHFKVILMYGWDGEPLWLTYSPLPDPIAKLSTLQCYLDLYPRISSFLPYLKIQMNI